MFLFVCLLFLVCGEGSVSVCHLLGSEIIILLQMLLTEQTGVLKVFQGEWLEMTTLFTELPLCVPLFLYVFAGDLLFNYLYRL